MLHGARVDRPRAPVAPSLSNTVPYRFSTEPFSRHFMCFIKKIKFPEKEEGYPGRTLLRVHRPRIPASFVIPGSLPWVSRLLPGFRRLPADLHRHHEPVSFTTTEPMPFRFLCLTVSGLICLYSPFSPEHTISLPSPDYWPCKSGN